MKSLMVVLVVSAAVMLGCGHPAEPAAERAAAAVRPVKTAAVAKSVHRVIEPIVGTVTARTKPVVSAKVNGTITFLGADVGDRVEAGQLLAEIEAKEIKARLDQAMPQLERARQDVERAKTLLAQKAASQQEYDNAVARVQTMEATVEEGRTLLGYTRVTSPIAGLVRARHVDVGDMAQSGRALFELEGLADFRLEAAIPESLTGRLHTGDAAEILVESGGRALHGKLADLSPSADPLSRTFLARYDVDTTSGLVSGQFGRLMLPVGESEELTIPRGALVRRGQMEVVFVVKEDRVRLRIVKSGQERGESIGILSGLSEGERLAVTSADLLEDGQRVEVTK